MNRVKKLAGRNNLLHYSYMELEQVNPCVFNIISIITLFLYGIGASVNLNSLVCVSWLHYSYMELELCFSLWRNTHSSLLLHYSYMELEHVLYTYILSLSVVLHYSYMELELIPLFIYHTRYNYYIIPIWNWSVLYFSSCPAIPA